MSHLPGASATLVQGRLAGLMPNSIEAKVPLALLQSSIAPSGGISRPNVKCEEKNAVFKKQKKKQKVRTKECVRLRIGREETRQPSENTQRTLGKQFHILDKTFRIVSQTGKDPLINDLVWYGLCSDLVAIGFCKDGTTAKWKWRKSYYDGVPLSLRSRDDDWTVYRRVLNQLPLLNAIHLAVYRWIAQLCRVFIQKKNPSISFIPSKCLLEIAARAKLFVKDFFNIPDPSLPITIEADAVDVRPTVPEDRSVTKVKFRLTEEGRKLLNNSYTTFQPVVPQNIRVHIHNSLRAPLIHSSLSSLSGLNAGEDPMLLYVHERVLEYTDPSVESELNHELALSSIRFHSSRDGRSKDLVESIRRCILQHLAGYPEGCANFGLRQLFGDGAEYERRLKLIEEFVTQLADTVVVQRPKKRVPNVKIRSPGEPVTPATKEQPVSTKRRKLSTGNIHADDAHLLLLLGK
jgi:hypothetical protein